jgi:alcohol dehydrogenase
MNFDHYIPTRILFGSGTLSALHEQALPGKKALIVTTAGQSVKKYGYLQQLTDQLDLGGVAYALFDKILPNPILEHVHEGAQLAKDEGCDFIVGLGGGSAIDSSKAIALMAANPGNYWDYIHGGSGKGLPVPNDPLPVVAVTTTAGTGTEADPWMVVTNGEEKIGFGYDKTFPVLSVVDPLLMVTVPPHLTAYQGFDALFHSAEGYICPFADPISDAYAIKSIELVGKGLAAAVKDGSNIAAREDVALANTLAGMVESTSSCTSEHSMAHALSAYHPKIEHGAALIMVSVAYFSHFAQSGVCDKRMTDMARALGKADAAGPMDFVDALAALQKACGVDGLKMSDYGVKEAELEKYTRNARETMGGLFDMDPAPLSDADVTEIFRRSYR